MGNQCSVAQVVKDKNADVEESGVDSSLIIDEPSKSEIPEARLADAKSADRINDMTREESQSEPEPEQGKQSGESEQLEKDELIEQVVQESDQKDVKQEATNASTDSLQEQPKTTSTKPKATAKSASAKAKPKPKPVPKKLSREEREAKERQARMRARMEADKKKKEDFNKNIDKHRARVEAMMNGTGEFAQKTGPKKSQVGGDMLIKMPTPADRENMRTVYLGQFREKYGKLNKNRSQEYCPSAPTTGYSQTETQGLQIKGGHMPMARPEGVKLPTDFRKPVGTLTLEQLQTYDCNSERIIVSVYGDLFDVSDRPDKYDKDGPYWFMAGQDTTWGFVSGRDTPEMVSKLYDLWKVAPQSLRDNKLKLIYGWVAWYEWEYGGCIGKLAEYEKENSLKGPPMEESEDCCIM
eukprot:TRINITY_DN51782_c0_g1_i1.p1 TRINITY_DN51782_c0_g1~~TRINITY_DN51782_c0_g1_i1.p1  ORF type:complete len:410 (+),score=72.80 TRINITY_DN51782_c0_g1_i1:73-1302(+)